MPRTFFVIKCNSLRMIRTLPTIWIRFVNRLPHCWVPKIGYSYKMKNWVPPPNETDLDSREDWHFAECEILFGKAFLRLMDGEMAIASSDCDPSWLLNEPDQAFGLKSQPVVATIRMSTNLVKPKLPTEPNNKIMPSPIIPELLSEILPDPSTIVPETLLEPTNLETDTNPIMSPPTSTEMVLTPIVPELLSELLPDPSPIVPETLPEPTNPKTDTNPTISPPTSTEMVLSPIVPDLLLEPSSPEMGTNPVTPALSTKTNTPSVDSNPITASEILPDPSPIVPETLPEPTNPEAGTIETEMLPEPMVLTTKRITRNMAATASSESNTADVDVPSRKNTEAKHLHDLSEAERYEENKRLCRLHNFPPPMSPRKFKSIAWPFTKTVAHKLKSGCVFKTPEELSAIPRSYDDPYCWPGPLLKESECEYWHLADSIVQEVWLNNHKSPYYVVRWRGYEDEFNTVEPLKCVLGTAVYRLFSSPTLYTACGVSGCVVRRSNRNITEAVPVQNSMNLALTRYDLAMASLMTHLSIEEKAGRYCPLIGFCSYDGMIEAMASQHKFLFETFLPIVQQFGTAMHVDKHYLGAICGNLSQVAEFKKISDCEITNPRTIKDCIYKGLSASRNGMSEDTAHYMCFFAPRKFGTTEKMDVVHPKLHMAVFTVRSLGNVKDAIYFDPSPFVRDIPSKIQSIKAPKFNTFTTKSGVPSETNDCLLQCMTYIIALATGHTLFEPDLKKPARKLEKLIIERAAKKSKAER